MKLRMKLAYSFTLLIAYSAILHCFSASALDFFKGKLKLSGDGAWTRVDFPSRLTQPAVFLGTPNYIGEFMLIPQLLVGTVDAKGFTARVVVPSCLHADLTGKTIVVPYLALPQTVEGDFLAMTARLNRDPNAAEFDTKKHAYAYRSWDGENAEYIVFVQIQNMADILDQATEDVKTPYAFAVADGKLQNKYVHFRMSAPISSTSSFVRVAILVLGGSAASYFGDNPIELKNQYLVTSGEAISHRLDSRVLAFIQPYYTETGYGYALKDSDDSSSITPLLTPSCTQSDQTYSYASYLLMISEFEDVATLSKSRQGSVWSTDSTCGEGAPQLVQVLFSDEPVLDSSIFDEVKSASSCATALNPSLLLRYNCDPENSSEATPCRAYRPQQGDGSSTGACSCPDSGLACSLQDALGDMTWTDELSSNIGVLVGDGLKFDTNTQRFVVPDASDANSTISEEDEGMMNPTPICEEAFSTRNTESSFEDQLCKATCTHLLQHLTDCYVPNSLRKTCAIREASNEYNPRFKTCGCAGDPTMEPCTVSEVENLKFDWAATFKATVEGKGGLLLLRNQKVMGDTGLVYTDEAMTGQAACGTALKYQGIFCRVDATVEVPERGASQHGHEILSKCDIPLEVQDIVEGESNMIASTVTITTEWERVTFPTQIAPNPVVFTGILHPLGTFGQVQITDVTESGFSIRLALDYCREGYAAAYAKVSWLAMSERPYKVSESGAALRVGTMVVRVDKRTEFLPGVKLNSSAPILLTQIQDIPSDLSMEDIPFINITQVDGTYARISLKSTTATPKQESFTVGFLYMDEVHGAECLTGCKLNNLAVEATSFELHTESDSPGSYREEHFSSRSPLIFGSIILPQDDGKRMLADVPGEDVTDATWAPKVFVVTNDTCEAFEFKEAAAGTLSSRVALLLVQAHLSTEDEENVPDFIPNCEKAKLKEAAGADLKRNCYVEPYVETGLTVTSSTTLPPVAETVKCRVVDMSTYPYSEDIGWNVHAMSCFCPQGFDPCTPAQVEQDRAHWLKDVSLWGELCRTYDNVQPIAWGFMQVTYDICMVKTNLKWQKRPYPLYSFDDIFLNGYLNRSGYNQCAEETPFVFCPTASLTTATTTVAPTWDWPENADCLPGSWEEWSDCSATCTPSDPNEPLPVRRRRRAQLLPARGRGAPCVLEETVPCTFESPTPCDSLCRHSEWSQWSECTEKSLDFGVIPVTASSREKHVFAESGGACAANRFREFDSSRCSGMEGPSSVQAGAPSALQVEAEASATTKAELWSEWSSCDAPTILKSCEEEAKLSGTTALQCLVTNIQNNQTLRGKCLLPPELEKEAAAPTCFASFARANDDESSEFRFLDPRSDTAQCLCLTANSVPCTAAEVFQSRQLLFEPLSAFACPLQDEAGAIFDADTSGSADSKLFFAAADSSKIFCPISSSKRQQQQVYNATYSTFATAAEMNEYCANGLPAQLKYSSSTPYDVGLDCEGATPKVSSVTAEDCKAKCLNIKQSCSESSANFLSCIATKRQTTDFDKEGPGATANSVRVRSRQIIQASSAGGAPCKFGSSTTEKSRGDGGTVETEVCTFQELCEDLDQENSLAFTPKPEPSLQLWSSDTTTTTSTEPTVDSSQRVICNIVDMSSAQTDLGYDAVYSVDVQKVLGLAGRYVELVNLAKE
ncbi:hypothetical protein Emed_000368 [Eimeria media]